MSLPDNFDQQVREAVRFFWRTRNESAGQQEGGRGRVIGGKNMDGFLSLVGEVVRSCGLPIDSVHTGKKGIPGYYRPLKSWDAIVLHEGRLLAALEFKSLVGSIGNNLNNRTEEALGNATDLWVAWRNGAFQPERHPGGGQAGDPRPPFVGYLLLLEDSDDSKRTLQGDGGHYPVLPEFQGASYAQRAHLLCKRLIHQGLYTSAALVLSSADTGAATGEARHLSAFTSARALFAGLAYRLGGA